MALWSLMINLEGNGGFSTQVSAPTPNRAVRLFLERRSLRQYLASCTGDGWPKSFAVGDVIAFLQMDGLTNMHLCQLHRNGKHMKIILVKTAADRKSNSKSNGRAGSVAAASTPVAARRSPRR